MTSFEANQQILNDTTSSINKSTNSKTSSDKEVIKINNCDLLKQSVISICNENQIEFNHNMRNQANNEGRDCISISNHSSVCPTSIPYSSRNYNYMSSSTSTFTSSSTALTTGGITTPHYHSSIMNNSSQPSLLTSISSAEQHSYPVSHTSVSTIGSYTSTSLSAEPGIGRNSFESGMFHPEMFKDGIVPCRPTTENNGCEKPFNLQNHRQFSLEKKLFCSANNNGARFSSCSETNKQSSNGIHEQHLFDEYVRMYGEEGNCRHWSYNNIPPNSTSAFQNTSLPPKNTSVPIYSEPHSQNNSQVHEFPDCRMESSWSRSNLNVTPINNREFVPENVDLTSTLKNDIKTCSDGHRPIHIISNEINKTSENSVSSHVRNQYNYHSLSLSQYQPYLQQSQQSLDDPIVCQEPETASNLERCNVAQSKEMLVNENQPKKSLDAEKKHVLTSSILPHNLPQSSAVKVNNAVQASSVLAIKEALHASSVLSVNTPRVSVNSSKDIGTIQQISSINTSLESMAEHHETLQTSPVLTMNVGTLETSSIHSSATISQSPILTNTTQQTLACHNSATVQVSTAVAVPQITSVQTDTGNKSHVASIHISRQVPPSLPLPLNNISESQSSNVQRGSLVMNSNASPQSIEPVLSTQVKIAGDSGSSEHSVAQFLLTPPHVQKFTKYLGSRDMMENMKKTSTRHVNNHIVAGNECSCLLCGVTVESSSHCHIDTLITVPSKISVSEKLSLMIGFPLPRDLLPSLHICPKCFHLVNEIDVLEHRLNVCRRDILFAMEQILDRNGVHISPYKRFQRQQCIVPYQSYEMQFPSFQQQPNSSSCLHVSFQNDGQNFQTLNHVYASQNQTHVMPDQLPSQNCDTNTSLGEQHSGVLTNGSHHENNYHQQGHDFHSHFVQPHYHQYHLHHHQEFSNNPSLNHTSGPSDLHKESSIPIGIKKICGEAEECKQQPVGNSFECRDQTVSVHQSSDTSVINQSHLHQTQQNEHFVTKQHSSCQVDQSLTHNSQLNPEAVSKDMEMQNLSLNSLQSSNNDHSKGISTSPIQTQLAPVNSEQLPSTLLNIAAESMETTLNSKDMDQHCSPSESTGTPCPEKSDNNLRSIQNNDSNQEPLFVNENAPDNLMSRPMSLLLSSYLQSDNRQYRPNSERISLNQLNFEKTHRCISQMKSDSDPVVKTVSIEKYFDPEIQVNADLDQNWTNRSNELSLDSVSENVINPSDCDIDIEKCDIKVEIAKDVVLNSMSTSPTSDTGKIERIHISKTNRSRPNSDHFPEASKKVDHVSQENKMIEANSTVPPINSLSPMSSGLDIFFKTTSPPPPPEGPPEGLRNVQDATEYHKPTLLGKNIKVKKHAKLQICRQCDQVFSNRQALIRHIERRHKNSQQSFTCDTCHRKFNSERTLKHHLESHKTYPCKFCGKILLQKLKLKKHLQEHAKGSLICKVCKKETGSMQALISHTKMHDRIPKSFICTICSKNFTCKRNLDHHARIHSGEKPFSCVNCGKYFRHRSNMIAHHKLCTGTFNYICAVCGKGFALKSLFERHTDEHEGRYAHLCIYCNKGFSKSSELLYHFQTHGEISTSGNIKCSTCGPKGCNVELSHVDNKKVICPICDKVVSRKDALPDHIAYHENKRKYKCEECAASFFYRSNHLFHVKAIHLQHKPYACTLCGMTFTHNGSYRLHIRIHNGERPFQCNSCGKTFSSKSNYRRHLKCHVIHAIVEPALNVTV